MSLRNPVKYPVKYYSWQDNQAPQLSDAEGIIKTILKACLVTGYGTKQGAGWTSLFEDDYRIVLRRPLRTGNPPDIKIENGTFAVSGSNVTRHRIVAQDNPASLDDATELSAVNLLARDNKCGKEWYCFVTDFAVILCYQMQVNGSTLDKNHLLYIGSAQKINDADSENFLCSYNTYTQTTGIATGCYGLLSTLSILKNLRPNKDYTTKHYLNLNVTEKYVNNDYFVQRIILDTFAVIPIFTAMTNQYADKVNAMVNIDGRQLFRYVNLSHNISNENKVLYIPLDYWEL